MNAPTRTAVQQLAHSRERMRRYLVCSGSAAQRQQRQSQRRRRAWVGVAVVGAVVGVLAWQQPWRRATGLASAAAFVVAALKAPGMLNTLAGHMDTLARWWHTLTQVLKPDDDARGTTGAPAESAPSGTTDPGTQPATSAP